MIPRLASAGVMAMGLGALSGGAQGDGGPAPGGSAAPAAGQYEATAEAVVEVKAPAGWTRSTSGNVSRWTAPDKRAELAVAPVDDGGHAQVKVAEIGVALGVADVR